MKALFFIILGALFTSGTKGDKLIIPAEWTKDFSITVMSGGGMIDESYSASFTYDSCVYLKRVGVKKIRNCVRLKSAGRAAILQKLRELKLDQVQNDRGTLVMDSGSTQICFSKNNEENCLSDGGEYKIAEKDYDKFSPAYQYLMKYAAK